MASYRYERDINPEDLVTEKPRELTPAEKRANWWHYHWYYVVLVVVAVLGIGYFVWEQATEVEPDYTVSVVGTENPDEVFLSNLEQRLTEQAEDVNGDGKIKVEVKSIWLNLRLSDQDADLRQLMESSQEKLNADLYLHQSVLFLVDDPAALEQVYGCFQKLDGTDPQEGEAVTISDFAVPLDDTTLAGVEGETETVWYMARRVNEGMDAAEMDCADTLWEKLT